jgi:hypothetical protein
MNQDNGLPFDLEEIIEVIRTIDVVVIGFTLFPERVLIDSRVKTGVLPMVRVVPPVASRAERMRDLVRLRPEFGVPDQQVFFVWPRSLASFRASGIWDAIVSKLMQDGDPTVQHQIDTAIADLRRLERRALEEAIAGESYQSLWERTA